MEPEVIIAIIAIVVLVTVLISLRGIIVTCHNCIAVGSTEDFFSDIWEGAAGNVWVIVGLLILCIPVYFILRLLIHFKKKKLTYRIQTRLTGDQRYRDAVETFNTACQNGTDVDEAKQNALDELRSKGVGKDEAEETMMFFALVQMMNK